MIRFSYFNAAFYFALLVCSLIMARKVSITGPITLFMGIFMVVHPSWTTNAWAGDCGNSMATLSLLLTIGAMIVTFIQLVWMRRVLSRSASAV